MIRLEHVLKFLQWKQESEGGYTGDDLTELANDMKFAGLVYLGKEKTSITLAEFFEIEQQIATDPLQVKKGIYDDLKSKRDLKNLETIPKSTFYRRVDQILLSLYFSEAEYRWFESQNIALYPQIIQLRKIVTLYQQYLLFPTLKHTAVLISRRFMNIL